MQSSHGECSGFNPALRSVLPLPGTQPQACRALLEVRLCADYSAVTQYKTTQQQHSSGFQLSQFTRTKERLSWAAAQDALRHVSPQSQQQETFTSGNHLRACGCTQKETVWNRLGWFLPGRIFFLFCFSTCLSLPNATSLRTVCVQSPQGCLLWESTMSCWFRGVLMLMEDAWREEPVAWWAPNVQLSLRDAYCFWQVMRLLRFEEIGGGLADGGCPSWLISRCVCEHVGVGPAQPQCFR